MPDRRTHCRRGHEMTEENSRWRNAGKYRLRGCRVCLKACARLKYRASMTGQAASEPVRAWEFSRAAS